MPRLTKELVDLAITLATPTINTLMEGGITKRNHLQIVAGSLNDGVLSTAKFEDGIPWEHKYGPVAMSKFNLTVKWKMPTRLIQQTMPEVLGDEGTTIWWGSWIDKQIVCACSGVQPWMDEMISKIIIDIIRGLLFQIQDDQFQEKVAVGQDFYWNLIRWVYFKDGEGFITLFIFLFHL